MWLPISASACVTPNIYLTCTHEEVVQVGEREAQTSWTLLSQNILGHGMNVWPGVQASHGTLAAVVGLKPPLCTIGQWPSSICSHVHFTYMSPFPAARGAVPMRCLSRKGMQQ